MRCLVTLGLGALSVLLPAHAQSTIEWEVVNRFPLFKKSADFVKLEQAWSPTGKAADTVNTPGFTKRLRDILPVHDTAWLPESGTYDKQVLFRATHEIRFRKQQAGAADQCAWSINGKRLANPAPCGQWQMVEVPAGKKFDLAYVESGSASPVESGGNEIREKLIVGLGDSFASGEGNPDHPATFDPSLGTKADYDWYVLKDSARFVEKDAQWWEPSCHRSLLSWQALAAMSEAIRNKQEVVQFASYACSGAEIYDGFMRAQFSPPGVSEHLVENNGFAPPVDGGSRNEPTKHNTRLMLSQQHALADLLCATSEKAVPIHKDWNQVSSYMDGVRENQYYYGPVTVYGCPDGYRKVHRVLSAMGGNDVGFSGIVTWTLMPGTARHEGILIYGQARKWALGVVRGLKVVEPERAVRGIAQLDTLYTGMNNVLGMYGIDPRSVLSLVYPNPTQGNDNLAVCNKRTRDGNKALQVFFRSVSGNSNFLFGINPKEYSSVNERFIAPLQLAQVKSFTSMGWRPVISESSFRTTDGVGHGYCAVSPACKGEACTAGDRVRFWNFPKPDVSAPQFPRIADISTFDAYDPTRTRGMRYGVDAVLAMAVKDKASRGQIQGDWITGTAHPTANVHALIADSIDLK